MKFIQKCKDHREIPAVFYGLLFFLGMAGIIAISQPLEEPPADFDAHSYLKMAANPFQNHANLPGHHEQRILPPLLVYGLSSVLDVPTRSSFIIIARLSFVALSCLIALVIFRHSKRSSFSFAMALTVVCSNWIFIYNLGNIYQLCDLFTYLFTLLIVIALVQKKKFHFLLFSILGILTRQNLIVLAFCGSAHLFFADLVILRNKTKSNASASQPFPTTAMMYDVLIFLLQATCVGLLFLSFPQSQTHTIQHLKWDWTNIPIMLRSFIYLSMPFTLIPLLQPIQTIKWMLRHWYLAVFAVITIYQPYSYYENTGYENALRLAMQGVWIYQLMACLIISEPMVKNPWRDLLTLLLPFAWCALVYGEHLGGLFGITPVMYQSLRWTLMVVWSLYIMGWIFSPGPARKTAPDRLKHNHGP